ncbi:MAG: hypothetical protein AB7U20_13810 [Planctomycetaceae bacterium]
MSLWRKHPDLCVISALLCGLFVFQHGEAALAAVGPRFLAVKSVVTTKFAEFVATDSEPLVADASVDAADAVPEAGGLNPAVQTTGSVSFAPGALQDSDAGRFGRAPQFGFLPICSEPDYYGCSR